MAAVLVIVKLPLAVPAVTLPLNVPPPELMLVPTVDVAEASAPQTKEMRSSTTRPLITVAWPPSKAMLPEIWRLSCWKSTQNVPECAASWPVYAPSQMPFTFTAGPLPMSDVVLPPPQATARPIRQTVMAPSSGAEMRFHVWS